MKKFNKISKVYVLCPAYIKTGGPELLHQLVHELNKIGIESYITYYDLKKNNEYTNVDFKKYVTDYKTVNDIEDKYNNIIITPEDSRPIKITKKIKNAKKILWWLSVDNFVKYYGLKNTLKNHNMLIFFILLLKREIFFSLSYIKKFDYHFCQSHYAINYLEKNRIFNYVYLSDYLNEDYLINTTPFDNKEDIVLYNPKKGQQFTKKLIENGSNLNFIPIQNLTTKQVKELLLKSKVYIDFGNHPGKDRIPREATICGCCIITNKKGSAKFYEDVPIDDEFKFEENDQNIDNILKKINECIENYDIEVNKFNKYRKIIKHEKTQFKIDVQNFFSK